jgi:hypothetical protein
MLLEQNTDVVGIIYYVVGTKYLSCGNMILRRQRLNARL